MSPRLKATTRHLALTLGVLAVISAVILLAWYPPPYFEILDPRKQIAWMFGLSLGLGPLLTLVLFKPGKKGLMGDLIVVGIVQVAALGFTAWQLYSERPYFMVFAVDRFNVLSKADAVIDHATDPGFLDKPWSGPVMLVATMPTDSKERSDLTLEVFAGAPELEQRPRYWSLYSENFEEVVTRARTLQSLISARPLQANTLQQMAASRGLPLEALVYWPIIGRKSDYAVILDRNDGSIVDAIAVDPWLE